MATQTRPLFMTGAALASAAAIVVATPHVMPGLTAPTPTALLQAEVELTDFAAFLSVGLNPINIAQAGFAGWRPGDPATDAETGVSGILYLWADSLVNGEVGVAPDDWDTSLVNDFFEGGQAAGLAALVDLILPEGPLRTLLDLIILGPGTITLAFNAVLGIAAGLVTAIPFVGPVIANGINAYLQGWDFIDGKPCVASGSGASDSCSIAGPSGVLAFASWQISQLFGGLFGGLTPEASAATALAVVETADEAAPAEEAPAEETAPAQAAAEETAAAEEQAPAEAPVEQTAPAEAPVADLVPADEVVDEVTDETAPAEDPALDAVIADLEAEAAAEETAPQDSAADTAAPDAAADEVAEADSAGADTADAGTDSEGEAA